MVIDSHWHNDHIWGNQVFDAGTDIISTEETRRMYLETRGHGAYDEFMKAAEANLEATKTGLEAARDERERRETKLWVDYHQAVVDAKPLLRHRPPNLAFEGRMLFHGARRSAELIAFENGHTESDAVLFLPNERIAFMSDLLFIDHMPYLGGGNPESLVHALETVSDLEPRLVLPGHGPVGTVESLSVLAGYVRTLDAMAREMVEDGVPEETIDEMAVPEPYADWLFAAFFPVNMHFLYQRWLGQHNLA
jgi:glyoxylase-like metal-dependent hydrolase (beta-lactamase superfamily II)